MRRPLKNSMSHQEISNGVAEISTSGHDYLIAIEMQNIYFVVWYDVRSTLKAADMAILNLDKK